MFAFHSKYLKSQEDVDAFLEAHKAWMKPLIDNKILICAGPKVPRNGGFIMLQTSDKDKALRIMAQDPYVTNGIAIYDVIEFEPKSFVEGFGELIK